MGPPPVPAASSSATPGTATSTSTSSERTAATAADGRRRWRTPSCGSWPASAAASAPNTASARPSGRGCTSTGARSRSTPSGPSSGRSTPPGSSIPTCSSPKARQPRGEWGREGPMHDWGISAGYHDVAGRWIDVPAETLAAIRAAMGEGEAPPGTAPPGTGPHDDPVVAFRPGQAPPGVTDGGPFELHTEDGAVAAVDAGGGLPPDLPLGYHRLVHAGDGRERLLIVSPGRCHLPPDLRTWGWAVQLYGARSRESWGIGDLADLRRLAAWSRRVGAGTCLLNPLHATVPDFPQASPYYPSSRCFRNPLYLRIEEVPGAGEAGDAESGAGRVDLAALAAEGRALNADRRIDRERVWKLKRTALEHLWVRFSASGGAPAFDAFCAEQGDTLTGFATHCALTERFPGAWVDWPEEYRRPDSPAVARFAAEHAERVGYHRWLQWLTETQLAAAGAGLDLMQDLAVGVDPGGADVWLWQDTMALGMRGGAPPDPFNPKGQAWSPPPCDPWRP